MGGVSKYTPELAEPVLERIAEGQSVRAICEDPAMPSRSTIMKWLRDHPEFASQYVLAKEHGAEALAEDMFDISDDGRNDWMQRLAFNGSHPSWEVCGEHINRSRLRVDTRKWYLSKILPKKYGDNAKIDLTAKVDSTVKQQAIELAQLPPELLAQIQEAMRNVSTKPAPND